MSKLSECPKFRIRRHFHWLFFIWSWFLKCRNILDKILKCKEREIISTSHPKGGRSSWCQARVRDPPGCYQGCWRRGSLGCRSRLSHLPTHICFTPAPRWKPRGKVPDATPFWDENEIPCFPLLATTAPKPAVRPNLMCQMALPVLLFLSLTIRQSGNHTSKITIYLISQKGRRVKFLQTVKTMDGRKRHSFFFFFNLYLLIYGWARSSVLLTGFLQL